MKIILEQEEIVGAIFKHVESEHGIQLEGKDVEVTLTAGRGANGLSATLDFDGKPAEKPATKKASTKKAAEKKPDPKKEEPKTTPEPDAEEEPAAEAQDTTEEQTEEVVEEAATEENSGDAEANDGGGESLFG